VKGTSGDVEVGSTGNTSCAGRTGVIEFQGNTGPAQELTAARLAVAVGNKPVGRTVEVKQEEKGADEAAQLDKAPATSGASVSLEKEDHAVAMGAIDRQSLNESKSEGISSEASFTQELEQSKQDRVLDQQQPVEEDPQFEQDLQQSQGRYEEIAVNVDIPAQDLPAVEVKPIPPQVEIPKIDVGGIIEDAVQENKNVKGRMTLDFDK